MATKKKAKKPAKVSSKRLATLAGRLLRLCREIQRTEPLAVHTVVKVSDLEALAASVLSQTEPVKTAKKAKKARKRYHAIEW